MRARARSLPPCVRVRRCCRCSCSLRGARSRRYPPTSSSTSTTISGCSRTPQTSSAVALPRRSTAIGRHCCRPCSRRWHALPVPYEYSWHTPGHAGGTAFLKHPAGRAFFEFFGEELFRSDLSISVGELGSLLDHSGPIGESERYAARVFGADRTYYVTNGSSTSNRVILMASVTRDQIALCDRNCHKSVEHAMTLTGAIPTYLMPSRNYLGLIGPIHPERLDPAAIAKSIADNALVKEGVDRKPVHAVVTNSTYDGLCYHIEQVEALLGKSVDRLHFDEAWYGYARFNPIYAKRFAMHGDPGQSRADRPTLFATQSTHKLLAALSQASYIHIRDGRRPIDHARFNEAFMMHASTSPQYAIIASNDIAAAMMDGPSGEALTGESIREAVAFRQTLARLNAEFQAKGDWFFNAWQPDTVTNTQSARRRRSTWPIQTGSRAIRRRGCCAPVNRGMASPTLRTGIACWTRSRCRLSLPAWDVTASFWPKGSRHRCFLRTSMRRASSSKRPPTLRSCSCSRWVSRAASGERLSMHCSDSIATFAPIRRSPGPFHRSWRPSHALRQPWAC